MPQVDLYTRLTELGGPLRRMRPTRGNRPRYGRRLRLEPLETRCLLTLDPSGQAQEMLENINRMRLDPQGELSVLFSSLNPLTARDADADIAIKYFNDPTAQEIQSDWPLLQAAPPLVWHAALDNTATTHSQLMIQYDQQSHQLPGEASLGTRIENAGYAHWMTVGENIYAYASSVSYGHSGFAIDWGVSDRGHRTNLMNADFQEIGISILSQDSPSAAVGPLVITEDFGARYDYGNADVLGVVYHDGNSNQRYDAGEGLGGVNIQVTGPGGTFTTTTMTAGGYQLKVSPGTYSVTVSGGGLPAPQSRGNVFVGSANVKVDFTGAVAVFPAVVNVTSSAANATYAAGAVIPLTVEFTQPVIVTGAPTLLLETGAVDHWATYASGSNSTSLTFNYTVQAGDTSADLDYANSAALSLAGGTIQNADGDPATLTLPAPGAPVLCEPIRTW